MGLAKFGGGKLKVLKFRTSAAVDEVIILILIAAALYVGAIAGRFQ